MFPGQTKEKIQHALVGNDLAGAVAYLLNEDEKGQTKTI